MRALVLLAVVGCAAAPRPLVSPPGVRVFEAVDDGAITEGETVLAVDPDTAYRAAIDYTRWPAIFPAVHQVVITSQRGVDALVTLVHGDGNRDNLHFHNRPAARTMWFEDTGGRAQVWGEIAFIPGDRPGTTVVHSRLYADVHGFASLFVSDHKLRRIRQERVRDDLVNMRGYFVRVASSQRHVQGGR